MTKKHSPVSVVKSDGTHMRGIDLIGQGFILDVHGHKVVDEGAYSFIVQDGKPIIEPVPLSRQEDKDYSKNEEELQLKNRIDLTEAIQAIPTKKKPGKKKKNGK